jgi:hypothetical protein
MDLEYRVDAEEVKFFLWDGMAVDYIAAKAA